ncbi:C10 family peptidase [Aquimarina longa]|uniref:C10 family peptidase n=1 Tax=Aquimarina longa TaxID=1080221 RepID=UPI0007854A38|nr:C10 family peptidase [Aquimarina longa]
MKRLLSYSTVILCFFFFGIRANVIDKKTAIDVANNWVNGGVHFRSSLSKKVQKVHEINYKGITAYYLIEYNEGGFVIVSADDAAKPILGYSDENLLEVSDNNPAIISWMEQYKEYVYNQVLISRTSKSNDVSPEWKNLRQGSLSGRRTEVIPFMNDIKYSQGAGWNKQCPEDTDGRDGHALVGCVATAMGQVLRYWEFPKTGSGSKTYSHNKYGKLSVNFGETTYHWSRMSKEVPDEENAKLLYHCGVAVNMNYGANSSGAYTYSLQNILKKYFKYDQSARQIYKHSYNQSDWNAIMKREMEAKRPVLYSGRSSLTKPAGHLFALDGYQVTEQGDYFHINWGWGGKSNGYFYLTEMITHNGEHNWIENNSAIINLKPRNMAPVITSIPVEEILINEKYEYVIHTFDENDDALQIELSKGAEWLQIVSDRNGYKLIGTPTSEYIGKHVIELKVKDATLSNNQVFTIVVKGEGNPNESSVVDFETNDYSQAEFSFINNAKWNLVQLNPDYGFSTKSLKIRNDERTQLSIHKSFDKEMIIEFDYKVSSEKDYDFLIFRIDGEEKNRWSGTTDWSQVRYTVSAGNHVFTWTYEKDYSISNGEDCIWLDNIYFGETEKIARVVEKSFNNEDRKIVSTLFNYPNPAQRETTINFYVAKKERVLVEILNANGTYHETIINRVMDAGSYTEKLNVAELSEKLYFIRMTSSQKSQIAKLLID